MMSYHHATFESDSDAPLNKKPKKVNKNQNQNQFDRKTILKYS